MLLSIIVPNYNKEKQIKKTLTSILSSTYRNIEVIVVDDGSTDSSVNIVKQIKDKRLSIYKINHKGVSYARNFGLSKAKGDYISFIDSDDYIDKNMFEKLMHHLIDSNIDIISCDVYHVYPKRKVTTSIKKDKLVIYDQNEALLSLFDYNNIYGYCVNKIYKRKIIDQNAFDTNISYLEDLLFNWETIKKTEKIGYIKYPLYYYNKNINSITNKGNTDFIKVYTYLLNESKTNPKLYDKTLLSYIDLFLFHYFYLDDKKNIKKQILPLIETVYKSKKYKKAYKLKIFVYLHFPLLIKLLKKVKYYFLFY